jgi:acetyltransferase-like isoleucine patch superfamily enzyme
MPKQKGATGRRGQDTGDSINDRKRKTLFDKLVIYKKLLDENVLEPYRNLWLGLYWYSKFPKANVAFDIPCTPKLKVVVGEEACSHMIHVYYDTAGVGSIKIGARTQIAKNVVFVISQAHKIGKPSESNGIRDGYIHIGSDVWIGHGVVVMPNITIGDGATIGAGAVVTHNVPPHDIVAGMPAHSIKKKRSD